MSFADKIAKFFIEVFTTHKFEELTPVEVTVIESLVIIILLLMLIAIR